MIVKDYECEIQLINELKDAKLSCLIKPSNPRVSGFTYTNSNPFLYNLMTLSKQKGPRKNGPFCLLIFFVVRVLSAFYISIKVFCRNAAR